MARLSISLLGPFQVKLDDEAVTTFESSKVKALLSYLAVEADRPHSRDLLAGLLWPEWPNRAARSNLRYALSNLRQAIGDRTAEPPFLLITRDTIQFNCTSDYELDVEEFAGRKLGDDVSQLEIDQLRRAAALCQGHFLEGFSVPDSAAFEEWALLKREQIDRVVLRTLRRLVAYDEARGEYERACDYAWREVELEPWQEESHQQLMRLLAFRGQRSAALAQYESCRRVLAEELGVEPAAETTRLYEQIRDGKLPVPSPARRVPVAPPAFLAAAARVEAERPVFVARERELAQLSWFVERTLVGQGQVAFVTGEAGSGKTALVQEFVRRAQDAHPDLLIASGNGNAHTGIGDPYLPFRAVLRALTGDVEAQWAAGAITSEHARGLWNALPLAAQALVEAGPDLIDTFVPGTALLQRALARAPDGADWLTALNRLVKRKESGPSGPGLQQSDLFEQYTRVLQTLARQAPLLLMLDDLQWADAGSVNLLFHLGRQLAASRILVVGAYRPEDVALGRAGERHPLEAVISEFQRDFGDTVVDMDQAEGRGFVEAILDSEPNQLNPAFRDILYQQTSGHPLFTVELLRGMQERGDIVQDAAGRWVEGSSLDWETLPVRVEAVIAERIGRLPAALRQTLRVASVEGEVFTAEAVAQVLQADEREMVSWLSSELDRTHRLVRAERILRMESQCLSSYRFRHILFQKYLYSSLDPVERVHLHEGVGTALETLYGEGVEEISVQLARHFQEAGIAQKAIPYLQRAGEKAVRLSANEEAIEHFTQAVALLDTLSDTPERARQELTLQLALDAPLQATKGYASPECGRARDRAYELCQQMGQTPELLPALWSLGSFYLARAEHHKSLRAAEQILTLAERMEDPLQVAMAHWGLGVDLVYVGQFAAARAHLGQLIAFYDPKHHGSLAFLYGQDPCASALAWLAWTLWFLGYPDQALKRSQEALALARELAHPFTLGFALNIAGVLFHQLRREYRVAEERNRAMMELSAKEGFPLFQALGTVFQGWSQALAGQLEAGTAQMRQGLATWQAMGTGMSRSHLLALLAQAYADGRQAAEGLTTVAEALTFVEESGERYYESELHRLRGELLRLQHDEAGAEASLRQAIDVARAQQARSWELRATMSLSRLLQVQDRREKARQLLAEIYGWFTEGFDTPDLHDAQELLERLTPNPAP
jgi:predicted ATPase/DNA-binding SARP family transcriptional activator